MHDDIQNIQNSLWKFYKQFKSDNDMESYNHNIQQLTRSFVDKPIMLSFCQNLIFAWTPVMNKLKENANGRT